MVCRQKHGLAVIRRRRSLQTSREAGDGRIPIPLSDQASYEAQKYKSLPSGERIRPIEKPSKNVQVTPRQALDAH